jgi:formylglycine-generating enzyme required for sulfatase activity
MSNPEPSADGHVARDTARRLLERSYPGVGLHEGQVGIYRNAMNVVLKVPVLANIAAFLAMCGGHVIGAESTKDGGNGGDDSATDDGGAMDGPLWDDVLRVPDCGQFATVPGGDVYVGAWAWSASNGAFTPTTTCDVMNPGNRVLKVNDFSLMDLPVTNVCYSECVKRGMCTAPMHSIGDPDPRVWSDPGRSDDPVYVDHDTAQNFCVWLGGYLPSVAQILRASQGDAKVVSVAAMTAAAINCFQHPDPMSQICGQIASMALSNPSNGLYPVGQVALDVGPYGHHDLFGEGFSWTKSFDNFEDPTFCATTDGTLDPVNFGNSTQFSVIQWGTLEQAAFVGNRQTINPGAVDPTDVNYQFSFRCAFDN